MISDSLVDKVKNYQPSEERLQALRDTNMVFMVGVSGAGKNAASNTLLAHYPQKYTRFVTHTTRKPRENRGIMEQNGREYYFIDFAEAELMLDNHDYLEANLYSGNIYGTSVAELRRAHDQHKTLISDIDVNGVAHLLQVMPQAKPVFILPPDFQTWQERFLSRYNGEINKEDYQKRMRTAYTEIEHALKHEYFYLVVNKKLVDVAKQIDAIARGEVIEHRPEEAVQVAKNILIELQKVI